MGARDQHQTELSYFAFIRSDFKSITTIEEVPSHYNLKLKVNTLVRKKKVFASSVHGGYR